MGHRYSGALAYADDITLLSPSKSGLTILVDECERYAAEYDILFNGNKSKLLYFRGRYCKPAKTGIDVIGQYVNISTTAVHLGHTISSDDKSQIVKSAASSFWRYFNIFTSNFQCLSASIKSKLFNQFCCSYYGAPIWSLKSNAVKSLCTDWRKALRSLWRVNPRTHCDIIIALSNQLPLITSLEKRFVKYITNSLYCANSFVNVVTKFAICNPMSSIGSNYRNLLDSHGELNCLNSILKWEEKKEKLHNTILTLRELIEIRDGLQECIGFTHDEIGAIILNICIK